MHSSVIPLYTEHLHTLSDTPPLCRTTKQGPFGQYPSTRVLKIATYVRSGRFMLTKPTLIFAQVSLGTVHRLHRPKGSLACP
jgi:hypothetical protein